MKRITSALICAFLMIICLAGCSADKKVEDTTGSTAADTTEKAKVPDFTVYTEDGEAVSLYEKLDKPLVLNFWATWCPPCKAEMPAFDALYGEYGEDIEFMMVNLTDGNRDTVAGVKAFLAETGYDFPVYYDSDSAAAYAFGVQSIPMTLFISPDGMLMNYHVGAMTEAQLRSVLDQMKRN